MSPAASATRATSSSGRLTKTPHVSAARRTAAVIATAELPAIAGAGSRIDVNVASLGDASSLQGGTLIITQLAGADGEVYAVAQGPIAVTGYSAAGMAESVRTVGSALQPVVEATLAGQLPAAEARMAAALDRLLA